MTMDSLLRLGRRAYVDSRFRERTPARDGR
jgi:hypothetical protein